MTPSVPESGRGDRRQRVATGTPTHNWRPTVVHGATLWLFLGVAAALPLGGPLDLAVAAVGVLAAPVVPVALYCDYRQARAYNQCAPGIAAYAGNLWRDLVTTVRDREPLGNARTRIEC